ncbi:MAG: CBS domain-containing protein [Armatimonadota bacterium]|nr:MAG: CBS domain-containing protein [Armatimonadota bacterium]
MVTAKQIMTKQVVSTVPYRKVEEVTRVLYHHGISGLPVLDEQKHVVGMVTEADILDRTIGQDTVQDIMSAPACTCCEDTPLQEIAALLTERKIKRLPVVREGELVGIISRADIVRALAGRRD